jgi:hypothetical protein
MRVVEGDEADTEAANGGQGLRRRRKSGASGTTTTKQQKKKKRGGGQRRRGSRSSRGANNSGEGLPGDHADGYEEDEAEIDEGEDEDDDDNEDGGDHDEDEEGEEEGDLLAAGEEVMGAGVSRRNLVPFLGDMAALYNTSSDNLFPTDALSRYELSGSNPMEAAAYGSGSSWANWGALGETPAGSCSLILPQRHEMAHSDGGWPS